MKQILKGVLTALLCLVLFGFQSAVAHRLPLFGAGFDLLPAAAVAAGVLGGAAAGGWTGFALGLFADMNRPGGLVLYTGIYFCLGALAGHLTRLYLRRSWLTALSLGLAATLVLQLGSGALAALVYQGSFAGITGRALRLTLGTGVLFPLVYGPFLLLDRLSPGTAVLRQDRAPRRIRSVHGRSRL